MSFRNRRALLKFSALWQPLEYFAYPLTAAGTDYGQVRRPSSWASNEPDFELVNH